MAAHQVHAHDAALLSSALAQITRDRAFIEQAKGMLMFIYGIDADDAFDVLRTQSQHHNVKLRLIAEQIVKDLVELTTSNPPAQRLAHDAIITNAHHRIAHVAERQLDGQCKTDG